MNTQTNGSCHTRGGDLPEASGGKPSTRNLQEPWTDGAVATAAGEVPRVRTRLNLRDRLGALAVRSDLGRMSYAVPPGLYAVGEPGAHSPVFVSANYKLSFDHLRRALDGRSGWVLVLDTKGVNVWCAAGKGTFGTEEIVRRVQATRLDQVVSHRRLIVPQLGAPGVCAHEVASRCGFRVEYGPVRTQDLPAFLDAGMKATPTMRLVRFGLRDRAVLIPVELFTGSKAAAFVAALFLLAAGWTLHGYSFQRVRSFGLSGAGLILGAFVLASVLGPLLLPWLPGRAFSVKGAVLGVVSMAALAALVRPAGFLESRLLLGASALLVPAITSFVVMNFTGASTFTSLSGVVHEMRRALPAQIAAGALGCALWIAGLLTAPAVAP